MEFTRKQRQRIYEQALTIYKNFKQPIKAGICLALSQSIETTQHIAEYKCENDLAYYHMENEFPELYAQKPKHYIDVYWWDVSDRKSRIKAFQKAINLCNPKK